MKRQLFTLIFLAASTAMYCQTNNSDSISGGMVTNQPATQDMALTATLKSSSRLFEFREDLTSVILVIPTGSIVKVTGSDSTYYRVIYDDTEGYIFKKHATINMAPVVMEPVKKQEQSSNNVQPQQTQVTRLSYLVNKYGPNMGERLYAGKIWRGMSAQMVRDSWGTPLKVNRDAGETIVKEEWAYKKAILLLENNILVDWKEVSNN